MTTTVERRAAIAQLLAQVGTVHVQDLVNRFEVSPPTIRRDLTWLESEGLARRVRGGAMVIRHLMPPRPEPAASSARIGKAAAKLVQDGETLFIGPGRLALETARALAERDRLTIVTNGLLIAREVALHSSHTLILTGGQLERPDQGLGGHLAHRSLRQLRAGRVFLELGGISAVDGLTDDSLPQAELARHLLDLGAEVVLLIEPVRIGRAAAAYIGPASEVDAVITAREVDSAFLWDLTEMGVRTILA